MKKHLFLLVLAAALCLQTLQPAAAKPKAKQDDSPWKYQTECAYKGTDGNFYVNFWSFSDTKKFDTVQACKEAVHITIFVGAKAKPGCQPEPFLIDPEKVTEEMAEYFDYDFFTHDGGYRNYIISFTQPTDKQSVKGGALFRTTVHVDRARLSAFLSTKF